MIWLVRTLLILSLAPFVASCDDGFDDDVTRIAFIGSPSDRTDNGVRLAPAGQHIRSATAEGLVGLDEAGEVVPALAERWIVTEDGLSYIFRLRNSEWSDGTAITSQNVRQVLQQNIGQLRGTSLGIDLTIISEIRAMTGRVIEIRLKSPMPQFLQLIAQPELGLRLNRIGVGPMQAVQTDDVTTLSALPPETRGFAAREDWEEQFREVSIVSVSAQLAAQSFEAGEVDAVFDGRLLSLPVADTGPLSSGTLRLDSVTGLFGLQINHSDGLLDERSLREAIALGIDRETILQPFNLAGWTPSTRVVPSDLPGSMIRAEERWAGVEYEQRRSEAKRRVIAWRGQNSSVEARLTVALPDSPGADLFFAELASDLDGIGIILERAKNGEKADLLLIDTLARIADRRWFLNQFNCALERGLCSPEADALVLDAISAQDPLVTEQLLVEAEQELLDAQAFIPIGPPIRWSLIRGGVEGFAENSSGLHPLFPLALRPI